MPQLFLIAATDRPTGKTIYGARAADGGLSFRTGSSLAGSVMRQLGLHTHPAKGTRFEIEEAGERIAAAAAALGHGSWLTDLRIILA